MNFGMLRVNTKDQYNRQVATTAIYIFTTVITYCLNTCINYALGIIWLLLYVYNLINSFQGK